MSEQTSRLPHLPSLFEQSRRNKAFAMSSTTSFCAVLRSVLVVALLLLAQVHDTLAQNTTTTGETVVFDWNITWVRANPDGMMDRPVVGINNQWPVPVINATKGDRLVITIHNLLGNETTSLHWHGLFQNGTSGMDGPVMVSQCALQPGQSATYNFTVSLPVPAVPQRRRRQNRSHAEQKHALSSFSLHIGSLERLSEKLTYFVAYSTA